MCHDEHSKIVAELVAPFHLSVPLAEEAANWAQFVRNFFHCLFPVLTCCLSSRFLQLDDEESAAQIAVNPLLHEVASFDQMDLASKQRRLAELRSAYPHVMEWRDFLMRLILAYKS